MTEEVKLQMIRQEINIALSHPETDSYIASKVSHIFRMLSNQKMTPENKIIVGKLKVKFENLQDPFDWNKNLVEHSDLTVIINILENLKDILS